MTLVTVSPSTRNEAREVGDVAVRFGIASVAAFAAAGVAGAAGGVLLLVGDEAAPTVGVWGRW